MQAASLAVAMIGQALAQARSLGLSHIIEEFLEECFAPDGHPHFACDGSFVGVSP